MIRWLLTGVYWKSIRYENGVQIDTTSFNFYFIHSIYVCFAQQWKLCWTLNCIEAIDVLCVFGRVCKWKWNCYTIDKSIFHLTCDSHLILFFPVLPLFSYSPRCVEFHFPNPISRIAFSVLGFFWSASCFPFFSREIKLTGYSLRL